MTNTFYYDDIQEFDSSFAEKAYYLSLIHI